jgi:hypothetical protein
MRHWTRSALLRYNISDFFSSLLEFRSESLGIIDRLMFEAVFVFPAF